MSSSGQFFLICSESDKFTYITEQMGGSSDPIKNYLKRWDSFRVMKENFLTAMAKEIEDNLEDYSSEIFSVPWKLKESLLYYHLAGTSGDKSFKSKMKRITSFELPKYRKCLKKDDIKNKKGEDVFRCDQSSCSGTVSVSGDTPVSDCAHIIVKYQHIPKHIRISLNMKPDGNYLAFLWTCNKCNPSGKCSGIPKSTKKGYRKFCKLVTNKDGKIIRIYSEMPAENHVVFTSLCVKDLDYCLYPKEMVDKYVKNRNTRYGHI